MSKEPLDSRRLRHSFASTCLACSVNVAEPAGGSLRPLVDATSARHLRGALCAPRLICPVPTDPRGSFIKKYQFSDVAGAAAAVRRGLMSRGPSHADGSNQLSRCRA